MKNKNTQHQQQKLKKILNFLKKTSNIILLLLASALISFIWQQRLAMPYLTAGKAAGGDYFNALTYAKFFAEHKPLPQTGWMPFWNGGIPIVGGYSTLFFYLMLPLTYLFSPAHSMELLSIIFILFFFIASHFLFWEISRNHILSLIFTGILIITPATYYSLTAEGLVTASAMQWLLPASLFFVIRFTKFQRLPILTAAAVLTGIAFIVHSAMALLTIFIPAFLFLLFSNTGDPQNATQTQQLQLLTKSFKERFKTKTYHLLFFSLISILIGSFGLYTLFLQMFFAAGSGACDSLQCWGNYPQHLTLWFSPLIIPPLLIFLPFTLLARLTKKLHFSEILAPFAAITPLIIYVTAAKLHLIDGLASAIFPRRLFWTIALFILLIASASARFTDKASKKLGFISSSLFIIVFTVLAIPKLPIITSFSLTDQLKIPNSMPMWIDQYIVPKYQTRIITDLFPDWLSLEENNWRIDSIRSDFFVWWNTISQTPSTRGYSNAPTKEHIDWLYYLQQTTLQSGSQPSQNPTTYRDKILFMLDAYAINYIAEVGNERYNPLLTSNTSLISKTTTIRETTFYKIKNKLISPIITPTNAARVLVVSDQNGFDTFNRAISLTNLNSKILMPIKGPQSIDKLSPKMLSDVDTVILYQFSGSRWNAIENFLQNGGKLFIDTGSLKNPPSQLPDFIGIKSLKKSTSNTQWDLTPTKSSKLLKNINTNKFSPLLFENNPWTIVAPQNSDALTNWMKPILTQSSSPVLSSGIVNDGQIIFSGFNLPFHINYYQNIEEAKLFKNILLELIPKPNQIGEFSVKRSKPNTITISTSNSSGVYFKENYHSGWKAVVNGQKTKVYKAGLDFMYIPIPQKDQEGTTHISLNFQGSLTTWLIPIISLTTLFLSLFYILTTTPFTILQKIFYNKIFKKLKTWWSKD